MPFIIIPILMISLVAFYKLNQATETQYKMRIFTLFDQISQYMTNKATATEANLLLLSDHQLVKQYALVEDESLRYEILLPHLLTVFKNVEKSIKEYYEIRFILPDGYEDARWAREGIKNINDHITDPDYLNDLRKTKETIKKYLVFDENTQQYALLFIHKLIMNDPASDTYTEAPKLRGYLAITVSLEELAKQIYNNRIGVTGFLSVINNQGEPIFLPENYKSNMPSDFLTQLADNQALDDSNPGILIIEDEPVFAFMRTLSKDMRLLALLPEKEISDNGRQLGKLILMITLFVLIVTIFFVFFALRQLILQPIAILNSAVDSIGNGQLDMDINIRRKDEIGQLAQSFLAMSKSLKQTHEAVTYTAAHDGLTGLPNRMKFQQHLSQTLHKSKFKQKFAVLFLDLDNFKQINDSMGHQAGDIMLQELATRFSSILRQNECGDDENIDNCESIVARIGGDEFIILLNNIDGPWNASTVAERLLKSIEEPIPVLDKQIYTSCSIGISLYPDDATSASELIKNGDIAMYHAKSQGKSHYQFYSEKLNEDMHDSLQMNTRLRVALEQNNFELHFQPKFDIKTNLIVGLEALLRWNDDELGVVSPSKFIPVAEQSGLITPMTEWVIHEICQQSINWFREGFKLVPISINVSSIQFKRRDLVSMIKACMKNTGLSPEYLEIEITETSLLTDTHEAIEILEELNKLNITVALDDFGTGYSSLSYLNQLPINTLKIDRSFVHEIKDAKKEYAIIDAIIALAHALDLKVVAEGVENDIQLEYLKERHCDMVQGYLLGRPMPVDKISKLLDNVNDKKK